MRSDAKKALEGIRVADFSWVWAGPHTTTMLSFMGAEVIKVESATRLDLVRKLPPFFGSQPGPNRCGWLNTQSPNKLSLTLDLRRPEAVELAKRLVSISDIVVENYRPHAMKGLGLGYEDLRTVKPDIIMLSSSGFGASGPDSEYVGYGNTQTFLSGMAYLTGYRDGLPADIGFPYGDPTSGLYGAVAILAALAHRRKTGEGQHIELSQWESVSCMTGEYLMDYAMNKRVPRRLGNRDEVMAPHGAYPCAGEDEWVSIAVGSEEEWGAFCHAIGKPHLLDDARFADLFSRWQNQDELDELISDWTSERTRHEAMSVLQSAGIAAFPCFHTYELLDDPHMKARGFFPVVDHPEVGLHPLPGPPWVLSATPGVVERPAPCLGEHNAYVLGELLGLPSERIAKLVGEKIAV